MAVSQIVTTEHQQSTTTSNATSDISITSNLMVTLPPPPPTSGHPIQGHTTLPTEVLLSCLVCGKNFVNIGRLKSHEKTHSKSRPFKCIDCGKTFTVRYSLICHTRVHTRERPYNCTICGSRFSQASSLKTHQIYKHTKDFPYLCKYCGRGFISPGQKHEHINRTHLKLTSSTTSATGNGTKRGANARKSKGLAVGHVEDGVGVGGLHLHATAPGPQMTTASVQTHLSLPPGPVF